MVKIQEVLNVTKTVKMVSENYTCNVEGVVTVDNNQPSHINDLKVSTKDGRVLFSGVVRNGNISNANLYGDEEHPNSVIIGTVEEFVNSVKEFDFTNDKNEDA
ncbi:MAG: hypothetical protein HDR74_06885 [Bacteroides sp.]|nr:hypothetical protein [Bacteroides sp.]